MGDSGEGPTLSLATQPEPRQPGHVSRVVVALVVAFGCSAPARPAERVVRPMSSTLAHAISAFGTTVSGRVLLHGVAPVPFFGVVVTDDLRVVVSLHVATIRSTDGRFEIPVRPGKWNIIIVGPGFGTAVLRDQQVIQGRSVALGDIRVDRHSTIRGRITDASGTPVAGAQVRISSDAFSELFAKDADVLTQLLLGSYETVSGPNGEYAIEGVKRIVTHPGDFRIRAIRGGDKSPEKRFSEDNHSFDLAIGRTGKIEGNVIDLQAVAVIARHAADRDMMTAIKVNPDRTFRFEDLTAGEYDLSVLARGVPKELTLARVTVVGGGSVSVRLSRP